MPKNQPEPDEESFASQMEALVAEAERSFEEQSHAKNASGMLRMLRPLMIGIEAMARASADQSRKLEKLQETLVTQASLDALINGVRGDFNQQGTVNQKMFDALHEELRGYKDNFLLDILQKPIIRDLIMLHDDMAEMQRRLELFARENEQCKICNETAPLVNEFMRNLCMSLDNTVGSILEILARLDVSLHPRSTGKLNKQKHRAVAVVETGVEAENGDIIDSVKPCFVWRERIFRPEEVVIKKWHGKT